jgi:ParB family chromosome partitioning protein
MANNIKKQSLGKGLDAIFEQEQDVDQHENGLLELRINDVEPDVNQPRKNFDQQKLQALAESIKDQGLIQPILVRKEKNIYRIIAGERRWRAAKLAGLTSITAIIKDYADEKVIQTALIENLQRQDLNPIEEATAFEKLMNDYGMTQERVAAVAGRSRPAIANTIRLLGLDDDIRKFVISGQLSEGHARTLLSLDNPIERNKIAEHIMGKDLSVREAERLVKRTIQLKNDSKTKTVEAEDPDIKKIEEKLMKLFSTKVMIHHNKNKGRITIEYYSNDDLDRIMELFGNKTKK